MSDYWVVRVRTAIEQIEAAIAANGDTPTAIAHLVDAANHVGDALCALAEEEGGHEE